MDEALSVPLPRPLRVVFVHGAWHGAWCWSALQAELDHRGVASYAIDLPGHGISTLPLGDLHGDAAHVRAAIDAIGHDVVLVGHSYGGAVITEASAGSAHVRHLVYLTAFVPDVGEGVSSLLLSMPRASIALSEAVVLRDDGNTVLDPGRAAAALYGNCPSGVIAAAVERLSPQPGATFAQTVTAAGWATIESTYVRCTLDEAIHIDHQTIMSSRCSEVLSVETDHSPFVSAVGSTADIIESAARRVGRSST